MKTARLLPFLIVVVAASSSAGPDSVQVARRAIQAQYDSLDRSYAHKDFEAVAKVFAPDATLKLVEENRSMPAPKFVGVLKRMSLALTILHSRTRITSFQEVAGGFEAEAVTSGTSLYAPPTRDARDPKPKPQSFQQKCRDTWKKIKDDWQITNRLIGD